MPMYLSYFNQAECHLKIDMENGKNKWMHEYTLTELFLCLMCFCFMGTFSLSPSIQTPLKGEKSGVFMTAASP